MARKSKLTLKQWEEVRERYIAGERISALAREFKVDESTIRERMKEDRPREKRVAPEKIKIAAAKSVENDLNDPIIRPLLDTMGEKDRSLFHVHKTDLLEIMAQANMAARYSAQNAHKLARMAQNELGKLDESAAPGTPEESQNGQSLMKAMSYQAASNESAKQPMKLLEITLKAPPPPPEDKPIRIIGGLPDRDYGNQ